MLRRLGVARKRGAGQPQSLGDRVDAADLVRTHEGLSGSFPSNTKFLTLPLLQSFHDVVHPLQDVLRQLPDVLQSRPDVQQ